MKCDDVGPMLLDDRARRTAEIEAHLAACSECQAMLLADRRARELGRWDSVPPMPAPGEWRRPAWRGSARFAFTAAGLAAVGVLAALPWITKPGRGVSPGVVERVAPERAVAATETEPLRATDDPPAPAAAGDDEESLLEDLVAQSAAFIGREVSVRDALYAPFGELPLWVSLPRNGSLDAPVFRKALYPIHNELNLEVQR